MDLTQYLFRQSGSSCRVFTLPSRSSLSAAEQLMTVLLSRNLPSERILNIEARDIHSFLGLLAENELAGYVLESIYLLALESEFRARFVTVDGVTTDLFTLISRQAALEAIKFEKFDNKFVTFLDLTSELKDQIIWLKGIVASRSVYGEPVQRLSGDFDCFLESRYIKQLDSLLIQDGFNVIVGDNGFCNQLGVGPVSSLDDLFLVPDDELVPSAAVGYFKNRCPIVDVKFNPLDRGLRMIELERFRREAQFISWRGRTFLSPDLIDQLIVSLTHLEKDRFIGWKQLLDIKLLAEKINLKPEKWSEFVRRCRVEGVATACCAGLSLAKDRLTLQGLDDVITEIGMVQHDPARKLLMFTVTPLFYWNTSSLPMLFVNALVSDDKSRKLSVLKHSFLPSESFLSTYYFRGQKLSALTYSLVLLLHWLVLILPGGLIRRSFGRAIWPDGQRRAKTN